ncbi:flagellin N-terminal helical domain-containing protein [Halarcobacter anaerophilus]|uniref:Flagellin n=1 Tax=Halarcobacter anaerophilus TaxID=877500 RepID=A0A4Q0Y2V4_9BACT|nr:flagellin [Halarcobacter anaerophilus]QDF29191.1 putative flagellar protein [Halarcobacter anaerophilus]RXJ64446.1 flagellin [Halarcobacter anaerophilus]
MQVNNSVQYDSSVYLNLNQSLNRISSGSQINSAADDPAGLAIAEQLKVENSSIAQSIDNAVSGIANIQIGDQALSEQSSILDQVKENLLQASTDTTSQEGREALLNDIQGLLGNLNNIASSTNYNGETLLQNAPDDTSASQSLQFQAGENAEDIIESDSIQSNTDGLGLDSLLNQDASTFTSESARNFLSSIDSAIDTVNSYRSDLGSTQNQLQSSVGNLMTQYTQTANATSTIKDVDYAQEVSNFSKQNILAQVGAYASAQSNNINQNIVNRLLT